MCASKLAPWEATSAWSWCSKCVQTREKTRRGEERGCGMSSAQSGRTACG